MKPETHEALKALGWVGKWIGVGLCVADAFMDLKLIKELKEHEEVKKTVEHRLQPNHEERAELLNVIRLLEPVCREPLLRRIHEAQIKGKENRLIRCLLEIEDEKRGDILEWLATLPEDKFCDMVDLLDDDKLSQLVTRGWRRAGATASTLDGAAASFINTLADLAEQHNQRRAGAPAGGMNP